MTILLSLGVHPSPMNLMGSLGLRVSLRSVRMAYGIVNQASLYSYFRSTRDLT